MIATKFCDTGQLLQAYLLLLKFVLLDGIILSGAPDSYARYPKWAHSYENTLSFEFKTKQSNGLLMYTDDANVNGNFYSITIADGRIQLDFRLGESSSDFRLRRPVTTIRVEEVRVDDDRWHTLRVHQSFENVKLELDYALVFKILNQRSFVFGNILKNSDVFVGGLPPNLHQVRSLSSPLRRYSRHLAANVRNLVYRLYPQGETSPQLLDGHGLRQNEDNFCRPTGFSSREVFVCQHKGRCYSTNDGPKCDCTLSDHEGRLCDIEKVDAELAFSGQEWIGYDVSSNSSGAIRMRFENLTLTFKTVHGNAMIFHAGDDKSYLHVMLEEGAVIATSKFAGTDPRMVRLFNEPGGRYDDDSWHTVVLERSLQLMTLTVDGISDDIRQYAPELDWIHNSFAYLGGIPKNIAVAGVNRAAFRGCIKLVEYSADAISIPFVNLADQGYGESVIRTGGDLSFSCKNPFQPADVLSFRDSATALALPRMNADNKGGSLSFHFRTTDPDGLLLFHGSLVDNSSEYIAFELIDGHVFMVIDLGAGPVRLQTTSRRVTDSNQWHSVYMERMRRTGHVVVDSQKTDFNTPGTSANLDVVDAVFLGGLPPSSLIYPSNIWSISLRKGFVGCIKNVRFNGISAKIASVFEATSNVTGISLGCPSSIDHCDPNPCQNYGKCERGTISYHCDCTDTNMEGRNCEKEQSSVKITEDQNILAFLPRTIYSEADQFEIRFKTNEARGCLLETRSNANPRSRILISIADAELRVILETNHGNHSFSWGDNVSNGQWHVAKLKRRGPRLLLYLDGKWGKSYYLPSSFAIEMDEIIGGRSFRTDNQLAPFRGELGGLTFNNIDLLEKVRQEVRTSKESKGQRNVKSKLSSVSFTNTTGYIVFSMEKISSLTGPYRVAFKFQTLVRTSLLFASLPTNSANFIMLQLINGRVVYSFRHGKSEGSMTSPKLPEGKHLSDMRWHTLLVYQDQKTKEHILLVDNTTAIASGGSGDERIELTGPVVLGGVPPAFTSLSAVHGRGFRGCMSALRISDRPLDFLDDAESKNGVDRGCAGPVARCSPSACSNGGRCIQQWTSIRCDCSLTAHSGKRCNDVATTATFTGEPSVIYYEYLPADRPSTSTDFLVMAFKTTDPSGVLFSVQCAAGQDYMTLYMDSGFLQVRYNLGSGDHHFGSFSQLVNDGRLHTVKMLRQKANVTLQLDRMVALKYAPKSRNELVTLNMHWRLVLGASLNTLHLTKRHRFRRRDLKLFDPFRGEISGVNFNGLQIIDLFARGSPRVFSIGPVQKSHEAPPTDVIGEDVMMHDQGMENPADALIESLGVGCLSVEEQQSCYIETEPAGFFTPVLPSAVTVPRRATHPPRERTTSTLGFTSLVASTAKVRTAPSFTIPPVRPTTPMGDLITTTMKYNEMETGDFPRTALVMIASLTVVLLIAIVVFCVFRCRQNPPPGEYPEAMNNNNNKPPSGYTAISSDLSPPLGGDPSKQPLLGRQPQMNGNGYQPLKGSVIPTGPPMNGNGNGAALNGNIKKKDFKEWYV